MLAQPEQRPLWPDGVIQTFPLGTADCAEENCIALLRELKGSVRQRPAGLINRGASDVGSPKCEVMPELRCDLLQDLDRVQDDFGSDAVSRENCNSGLHDFNIPAFRA